MSGVWVFKNGVAKLVQNPLLDPLDNIQVGWTTPKKVLVHIPTQEVVSSYEELEQKLLDLGWRRYYKNNNSVGSMIPTYETNHKNNMFNNTNENIQNDEDKRDHGNENRINTGPSANNKNNNGVGNNIATNYHSYNNEDVIQFHRCFSSPHLISLPADSRRFKLMHMYDIVLKNRQHFQVRDYNYNDERRGNITHECLTLCK